MKDLHLLKVIGLNHKTSPLELREKFSISPEKEKKFLQGLKEKILWEEIVLLSTCNRLEIIFLSSSSLSLEEQKKIFGQSYSQEFFYAYEGKSAFTHLCRVCSGLDSLVLGEPEIFGQFKKSFETAFIQLRAGKKFHSIYQYVLSCAKELRYESNFHMGSLSIAFVATKLIPRVFSNLSNKKVLIIGAGDLCFSLGVHLSKFNFEKTFVTNRTSSKGEDLAQSLSGEFLPWDSWIDCLENVDVVFSCVQVDNYILDYPMLKDLCKKRYDESLLFIDLSVPRAIEPKINSLENIYLYNIDHLQVIVEENKKNRLEQLPKAEDFLIKKVNSFLQEKENLDEISQLISSFLEQFEEIKVDETKRLFNSLELDKKGKEKVIKTINRISNKLIHNPLVYLKKKKHKRGLVEQFKEFFNL